MNLTQGTEPVNAWEAIEPLDHHDPEVRVFQDLVKHLKRKKYTPKSPYKGVCGYAMPNGILIMLNYRCTVCGSIRTVPVAGVIGTTVEHEPVGCLRCKQFSTVFAGVEVESI